MWLSSQIRFVLSWIQQHLHWSCAQSSSVSLIHHWMETILKDRDLEGVTTRWHEAGAVRLASHWCGGHQFGDVANVPDVLWALHGRQVDVIQRKATLWRTLSSYALKNHSSLLGNVQIDVVQLPGSHGTSCNHNRRIKSDVCIWVTLETNFKIVPNYFRVA